MKFSTGKNGQRRREMNLKELTSILWLALCLLRSFSRGCLSVVIPSPVQTPQGVQYEYDVGWIADQDEAARVPGKNDEWQSYFMPGKVWLTYRDKKDQPPVVDIRWRLEERQTIKVHRGRNGRGGEFSELIIYQGRLVTCDDKTGIVYILYRGLSPIPPFNVHWKIYPWLTLYDNETTDSRFKCEWAAVKDNQLFIGGPGVSRKTSVVQKIDFSGQVERVDWERNYKAMKAAAGIGESGYIAHEAGAWSENLKRWIFIPRKVSQTAFEEKTDETQGSNIVILADEQFQNIEVRRVAGELTPSRGVSSFKFIPMPNSVHAIVALKTEERIVNATTKYCATYILAFDLKGRQLFPETLIEQIKYEGIEFTGRK